MPRYRKTVTNQWSVKGKDLDDLFFGNFPSEQNWIEKKVKRNVSWDKKFQNMKYG